MALADYYERSALAAAQVLSGFDREAFATRLEEKPIGLALDADAADSPEGAALVEMALRLLSRLYPRIYLAGPAPGVDTNRQLAAEINPNIEISETAPDLGISIGGHAERFETTVFAGADGWDALIDDQKAQPLGNSGNVLGAAAAGALAAANLFRAVFLDEPELDRGLRFSTWNLDRGPSRDAPSADALRDLGDVVQIGNGAVGNSFAWTLTRVPASGVLHVVDDETVDLGNLQRYLLAARDAVGKPKVELNLGSVDGIKIVPHQCSFAEFVADHGYAWPLIVAAVDSAQARRDIQTALPGSVLNAWTQPGDLGVSVHSEFGGDGACLYCIYLPNEQMLNEDEIVARALGVPHHGPLVGTLLHTGAPVEKPLLDEIAAALGVSADLTAQFAGRGIRELYVEGVCGGALIPLGQGGQPQGEIHVPLAHQSALAGVMLAAATVRQSLAGMPKATTICRLDLLRPLGSHLAQPALRKSHGRCICADADYRGAYAAKWKNRPAEKAAA